MKQGTKYTIIFSLFAIAMISIMYYFTNRYSDVEIMNKGKKLLSQLYELKSGRYEYKDGLISSETNTYYSDNYKLDGEGVIDIDKYGNVKYYIDTNGMCVYKTSTGNVKLTKSKCKEFETLVVESIKNNNKVSFTSLIDNLEYKISNKDDFRGEWISQEYSGNLIISRYSEGENYIWFRDSEGNISDVINFTIDCLNTSGAQYNKDVFYCTGSTVFVDNIEWIVVEDKSSEITLMKKTSLDEMMSHCKSEVSENCYYNDDSYISYKWSNSYVNNYLNSEFINVLSDETKDNLAIKYICDEYSNNNCNNGNCGGYKKEVINHNGWSCIDYSPSKVRIISFDEYNHLYSKLSDNTLIKGNYLMINSLSSDKASVVDSDYSVYIMEHLLNVNKIRPVITLKK